MEPMDIQAERRNTAKERQRAEEERQRAEKAEEALEKVIWAFIEMCQELSMSKEATIQKAVEKFDINEKEAVEKVERYWKA